MYIGLDCETGGIGDGISLLEVFFGIYDSRLTLQDQLLLKVKPDDDIYKVQAEGLSVNRINLIEHDKIAIPYKQAKTPLYEFLKKNSQNGKIKLVPIGHHVDGDIRWVCQNLISREAWEHNCSYRKLDTGTIAQFLKLKGIIPDDVSGSLSSLAKYYDLSFNGSAHEARADVDMTVQILRKMVKDEELAIM